MAPRNRARSLTAAATTIGLLLALVIVWRFSVAQAQDPLTAAKQEIEQKYADQMSAAPKDSRAKDPVGARPTDDAIEAWPAGIFEEREGPFPASRYEVVNRWQSDFGGNHVVVYAGGKVEDVTRAPTQGVLVVQMISLDMVETKEVEVLGPAAQGPLRIVSATGHVLIIQTASGLRGRFDVDQLSLGW